MVAIVSGNALGLLNSQLAPQLGSGSATATTGRNGEAASVNVANGNLVLQRRDEILRATGLGASLLRTYNSQAQFTDDNNDAWWINGYRRLLNLTGSLNTAGSAIQRVDADGSLQQFNYDPTLAAYRSTDGAGAHDTLRYDAATQRWTWREGSSGQQDTYEGYGSYWRLVSAQDPNGNQQTYTYSGALLTRIQTTTGDSIEFSYSGNNLTQERIRRADGSYLGRTYYRYDALDRLSEVLVDLTPDDGAITDGQVYSTRYTYDGSSNRLASLTQTDGSTLGFTYVQVGSDYRLATVTDALGQVTRFTYDVANRSTTVTDALGYVTSYRYDAAGQLLDVTGPATSGAPQKVSYQYDSNGNLLQSTDALGNTVSYGYDASGNVLSQQDSAGNRIERSYNSANQLLTETVYRQPDPDGAGSAVATLPETTRYVYDANQNLRFLISAQGRISEYRYDAQGLKLSSHSYLANLYPLTGLTTSQAPTLAQLTSWVATQPAGQTTREDYGYDTRGQLISLTRYATVDANGVGIVDDGASTTRYGYDASGNLLSQVDGNGRQTSYSYDGMNRLLSTVDALGQSSTHQYDDANRRVVHLLVNGRVDTETYDAAGQLLSVIRGGLAPTQYRYDADGRLRLTIDGNGAKTHRLYDARGNLIARIDANGALTEYLYNAAGQLSQTIAYGTLLGTAQLASLTDAANQPLAVDLATLRPAGTATDQVSWQLYDAAGRLSKTVDALGYVTEIRYDGVGRIERSIAYATPVATTGLNAGTRASDLTPTSAAGDRVTRNFYDNDGLLVGQLDAEGYLTVHDYDASGRKNHTVRYATATASANRANGTLASLTPATHAQDQHNWFLYDGQDRLVGTVDAEGYLTEVQYDAVGNVLRSIRYAKAVVANASSTLDGLRTAATQSGQDQVVSYTYTALNQVATQTAVDGTLTRTTYDALGQVIASERAAGTAEARQTLARYNAHGQVIATLSGEGAAKLVAGLTPAQIDAIWAQYGTQYAYDQAGRKVRSSVQNPDGSSNTTLSYYTAAGQLRYQVNSLGEVTAFTYTAQGQQASQRSYVNRLSLGTIDGWTGGVADSAIDSAIAALNHALDRVSQYRYNSRGELTQTIDSLGYTLDTSYNAFGELSQRKQALGDGRFTIQQYDYDRRGLLTVTRDDPAGALARSQTTTYDAFGRLVSTLNPLGRTTTQVYDRLGRVVQTVDALGISRYSSYDAFDRTVTSTDALGNVTRYSYDVASRTATLTTPDGVVTRRVNNRHGETISVTDGLGNSTSYLYDKNGQLLQTTDARGKTSSQAYDQLGRLFQSTDANGVVTQYQYDAVGRQLKRIVDPTGLQLQTSWTYDALGNRLTETQGTVAVPAQRSTTYQYDAKGQLLSKTLANGSSAIKTSYTYDATGKTLTVVEGDGSIAARKTEYQYDVLGRRTAEILDPAGLKLTTRYGYDANDNVVTKTDAAGNVTRYAYDARNQLRFTVDALGYVVENRYDAQGQLVST
ncbi:hypothetical protein, partial [Chitiniphilus shinanonensis]